MTNEPYLLAMPGPPDDPEAWYLEAPVDFKDPSKHITLIIASSRILSGDRPLYSKTEVKADPALADTALRNTHTNRLSRGKGNDFLSLRSNSTGIPAAAAFLTDGREKIFRAAGVDPYQYYFVFLTADEVLLTEKSGLKPSAIRRLVKNAENRLRSSYHDDAPILSTEVLEYGTDRRYHEA